MPTIVEFVAIGCLSPMPRTSTILAPTLRPIAATAFARRVESLTHVFLGKDNQAPGFGGALYSNLRVWRRRVDVLSSDDGAADDDDDADDNDNDEQRDSDAENDDTLHRDKRARTGN